MLSPLSLRVRVPMLTGGLRISFHITYRDVKEAALMAERVSDERRMELLAMIVSSYLSAFNGPEMRPPDAKSLAQFIEDITDALDRKYPRPQD